jgi:dTDP-4-amino-4,6-dideoxygalactose transaminase
MVGTIAPVSTFSFYPTKNLAAFGDAGGVATHHPDVAERMHCIRDLGQTKRFEHTSMGLNSRLDELQAAILHVKLAYLDQNNEARRERAAWYQELLSDVVGLQLPVEPEGCYHVYHLYVIRHPQRDRLRQHLLDCGIGCDVHYPTSLNRQPVFAQCGLPEAGVPNAELATQEILSLPIYPSLTRSEVEYIAETIRAFQ